VAAGTGGKAAEARDSQATRSTRGTRKTRIGQTSREEVERFFLAKVGVTRVSLQTEAGLLGADHKLDQLWLSA
jgi:porphobilinogen deaminase